MTDQQLKAMFPKLLPWEVELTPQGLVRMTKDYSAYPKKGYVLVKDTELLSLCREVELALFMDKGCTDYYDKLEAICERDFDDVKLFWSNAHHASWQQRIQAAAEVRGVV